MKRSAVSPAVVPLQLLDSLEHFGGRWRCLALEEVSDAACVLQESETTVWGLRIGS